MKSPLVLVTLLAALCLCSALKCYFCKSAVILGYYKYGDQRCENPNSTSMFNSTNECDGQCLYAVGALAAGGHGHFRSCVPAGVCGQDATTGLPVFAKVEFFCCNDKDKCNSASSVAKLTASFLITLLAALTPKVII